MPRQISAFLLGLFIATVAVTAAAAETDRPCRADVMNHCGEVIGDRDRMRTCMRENFPKFSEQCQARIRERQGSGGRPGNRTAPPRRSQESGDQ